MSPRSEQQPADDEAPKSPSSRSLRGLDGLNFLMADVRDGLGPFLSVYLKGTQHWGSGNIGLVMAASGVAAAICQIPAGLLVDAVRVKRLLIAISGLLVGAGCLLIAFFPKLPTVLAAQITLGAASAIIPPCLAALSLGVVGHRLLPARISRNEGFNHAGNFTAAVLAGALGQYVGVIWLFYLICGFAVASALVVLLIKPKEIDHELARGAEKPSETKGRTSPMTFSALWKKRDLKVFIISVVLFHFGNAAMLPLAGQVIAKVHPGMDVIALSACVIAAQLVMVAVAATVGHALHKGVGRKKIFLVALAVLPVRGVLFSMTSSPYAVVAIQLLDGVAAGIFGVIGVVIASDLMRGTGRFNLAQGLMALAVGIGAALSNVTGGYVVEKFGFTAGFLSLAAISALALIFFTAFMPETRPHEDGKAVPGGQLRDFIPTSN
ncbi:putative MFS family arabinose efflux permease [Paraburkholderia sp. BL18I3N2]|uniref:MFS transporter n=1 Tax=Paraburkholderia sp. BL18I3N2 TaxID=1938799 RepID=UPI000D063FED|nr:MFS transporter [Paraburkholderia sp. BL18I3N2]PRX33465.1 putative MFS family arabinose efflux permease [Paraburkholderia sp. BL18I3N2]